MLPPPFDIYICFCVEVIIKLIQPDGGIQDATIWPSQVSDYLQVALINWFPNCDPKEKLDIHYLGPKPVKTADPQA